MTDRICKSINKLFPLPVHPFNLQNEGELSYAMWQYQRGGETIKFYLDKTTTKQMFEGKTVLDIGCGAGGKTLYYASLGVTKIYGMDVVERYEAEAKKLAKETKNEDKFTFLLGDAAKTKFSDNSFDTIIMNDAMEHVDNPEGVLLECYRILKKGGRLYINFPPYNHPFGAHLSDVIAIPWVHLFFSDKTLIKVYKDLVKDKPDGNDRVSFRISKDKAGKEYFSYINHMTIKRFKGLLKGSKFNCFYYNEVPLRAFLKPVARLPLLKEFFVKMAVVILEK